MSGSEAMLRAMSYALSHRGPDDSGTWHDEKGSAGFGHARLSIIDLTKDGHQPMTSPSGRFVISYNGEIYNFRELAADLGSEGVRFQGRSDTEVILAGVDAWGLNATLQKINGMFAFALWDKQESQLHLVRDRLGKKPLYIGWAGDRLIFSSELKAFHACNDFDPQISPEGLSLYMRYACVPAPYSIFRGVFTLLPGTRITLSPSCLARDMDIPGRMEPYWHHPRVVEDAQTRALKEEPDALADSFESLLGSCVSQRMISDVPLGAFLSGGVDSSLVVAMMQKMSDKPVNTYTIGFDVPGYNEAGHARDIAAHLGTCHHEEILDVRAALDLIPDLPGIYDEPFADPSQIPSALVARFAASDVTVALSGDGGDEMFGGYNRHATLPRIWAGVGWLPGPARRGLAALLKAAPPDLLDRLRPGHPQFGTHLHKLAALLPEGDIESAYQNLLSQWKDPAALVLNAAEPEIPLTSSSWQVDDLSPSEKMMYHDALSYLPNDILVKMDRASMAASLEVRAPLLDKRIFEFAWRLPLAARIHKGQGKWLLRQVLAKYVPQEMFDRPKQGFTPPIGGWLRHELRDWAESLLDPDRIEGQGLLDPALVTQTWHDHLGGRADHSGRLWTILMFQAWYDRWMRG